MIFTHYGMAMGAPAALGAWAREAAKDLSFLLEELGDTERGVAVDPLLVYRGMSGVASATAMSLALCRVRVPHGMAYVRKPGEKSHGKSVELSIPHRSAHQLLVFVDDLVASGDTREASTVAVMGELFEFKVATFRLAISALHRDRNWAVCENVHLVEPSWIQGRNVPKRWSLLGNWTDAWPTLKQLIRGRSPLDAAP